MKNLLLATTVCMCGTALTATAAVFPSDVAFAAVTVTSMDTIRINVTNPTTDASCTVKVGFLSGDGSVYKTTEVSLMPGTTKSVSFSLADIAGSVDARSMHVAVRSALLFPPGPCRALIGLLELADAVSGRTNAFLLPSVAGTN